MNKKNLYWSSLIGGWLFYVLLNSLFLLLSNSFTSHTAESMLILFLFGIILSHLYRNLIVELGWLKIKVLFLIFRVIIATFVLAVVLEYAQYGLELLLGIAGNKHKDTIIVITNILNFAFVFFFWSLIYFLFHYIENYKKVEIQNLKWEASINEIELNKLKSQLNPHFMFNAMNSIRALVDENPNKSKDAITQLSNILRNTLQMGKNKVIPFDEEMNVVRDYIALESIRYEERLRIILTIDKDSSRFNIPPLMIQTLVENGIKHGISKLTNGGTLELITTVEQQKLNIIIRNSGQIGEYQNNESGFGIKNTLQRLHLLYGDGASLKITNKDTTTVETTLIIPEKLINT